MTLSSSINILFAVLVAIYFVFATIKPVNALGGLMNCTRGSWGDASQCYPCPRGRYGLTDGLSTKYCSAACPLGKYNDLLGGVSEDDCRNCPVGTYGSDTGLTTAKCSGLCPPGKYSSRIGLTSISGCVNCPIGYYSWQCNLGAKDKKMAEMGSVLPRVKQQY